MLLRTASPGLLEMAGGGVLELDLAHFAFGFLGHNTSRHLPGVPAPKPLLYTSQVPGDTRSRQNATLLQLLREATELFTLLSLVNNEAFVALMNPSTGTPPARTTEHQTYLPEWEFRLIGTLSPNDAAVTQPQVTWGALLGFPGDPWGYSADFRAAAEKLEAMGVEEKSSKACIVGWSAIYWTFRHQDSVLHIDGAQIPSKCVDPSNSIRDQLRRLFDVVVPHIVLVGAVRGYTTPVHNRESPRLVCKSVGATIQNWSHPVISELTTALATTAISTLSIDFCHDAMISRQAIRNAGFFLNRLVCGDAVRLIDENRNNMIHDTFPVAFGKLRLSGSRVCYRAFTAIGSAVAELSVEADLVRLSMQLEGPGRWPWLIYALCCGYSNIVIPSVHVWWGTATKSDILAISTVLQTQYPQPILGTAQNDHHQYGFVDFQGGTELRLRGAHYGEDCVVVLSSACRCRALYDPADDAWVNVIVPGYGACKTKIGAGSRFTPDSKLLDFSKKRLSGSFWIQHATFESPDVLMDLLTLVTSGLRSLLLNTETPVQLDLSSLCIACPELEDLTIEKCNVIVSAHEEPLRRWPIRTIDLSACTGKLADLTGCLQNPTLRMARQLVKLEVTERQIEGIDDEEARELMAHDGEFLPVTKEKFPVESKAAMISVATSASRVTKAIHRLDAYVLSLIFVFASTPEQRSVVCWFKRRR